MLRSLVSVGSCTALVLAAAMIFSCGGSSDHHTETTCAIGPFNVVGNWQGSLALGSGSSQVVGVINTGGEALFFDANSPLTDPASGSVAVLPSITGVCSFSGTTTLYSSAGAGGGTATATTQGSVDATTSVSATFSGGANGLLSLHPFSPVSGSVTALSDARGGAIEGAVPSLIPLVFAPTGTGNNMAVTNNSALSNCTLSGTFTQEGANDIFDVSIAFTGTAPGCPIPEVITGLGFESFTDYFGMNGGIPATYLYAVSASRAFVLEVYPGP